MSVTSKSGRVGKTISRIAMSQGLAEWTQELIQHKRGCLVQGQPLLVLESRESQIHSR